MQLRLIKKDLGQKISICDAFGGSGIRGVRYAKEIDKVENVVISDINPLAVKFAHENIELNELNNVKVL